MRDVKMKTWRNVTLGLTLGALLAGGVWSDGAMAQDGSLFAPKLIINGQVITNYEFEQRVKFLTVLRAAADPQKEALDGLTADRLSAEEAARVDVKLTQEQIDAGMKEFAGRANLDVPAFIKAIKDEGVDEETFRDFVTSGLLWRDVVRKKYGNSVIISDVQVDRALAEAARKPEVKLLLSELILPVPQGTDAAEVVDQVRDIRDNLGAEGGFASAARKYSASPSAERGGRLDWIPISNLPPAIVEQLLSLGQGEVSQPVVVPQAVVLFQLNGLSDMESPQPSEVKVSYAEFSLPADRNPQDILATVDGCGDLYPVARGIDGSQLRVTPEISMSAVPADIGLALAKLDQGEGVVRNGNGLLMLCTRNGIIAPPPAAPDATAAANGAEPSPTPAAQATAQDGASENAGGDGEGKLVKPDPQREQIRNQLGARQLTALAEAYMEELRSEAIITTP